MCLSARGAAAPRDKEQHHASPKCRSESTPLSPPASADVDQAVVDDPVARTAPAAAGISIVRPDRPSSSVRPDPELHQKEQAATSAGSRHERVCLLTDHVPVGARRHRAKG